MKKLTTVILDNGHGSDTPGKRSPVWQDKTQLFEYEFNRAIVKRVAEELKRQNIDVIILVPEYYDVPLGARVRRINEICKTKSAFVVSIHANAGGGTGYEIFTSKGETRSDKIATVFYNKAQAVFPKWRMRADYTDGDPDKESQFYILRKTVCPAVLTENFFMDTEKDCRFIMSEHGRNLVAQAHIEAIKEILA